MDQFQQFDISDFFNQLEEPLFLMDSEEIIFFNKHFLENYQAVGDSWKSYFALDKALVEVERFFAGENGSLPKVQANLVSKTGEEVALEWCFTPLPSSYSSRFLIAKGQKFQKSTPSASVSRHNLEDAIGREHRYMQSILTNYHDLIAIFDREGNYLYVSNSVEKNVGIPASDLLGRNYKEFVAAGIFEIVKGSFEEILNSKEEVALDFWINLSTGRRIYLESFARNLLDHPQIQGILFSSRDITEFILTEQSLQRRYEIENQINLISAQLINGRWSNLEDEFDKALIQFGEMLKAEESKILIINRDTRELEVLNQWSRTGDQSTVTSPRYFALVNSVKGELENGKVVQRPLKIKIKVSREEVERRMLLIPLISAQKLLGIIQFEFNPAVFFLAEKEIQIFRQLGDILAGAYLGSQMMRRLQRNENLLANTEILSNSGSWRFGAHNKRFHFSGGLSKLLGMGDRPIITDFAALIYKIDKAYRKEFIQNLKQASDQLQRTSGEFTITGKEGKQRYISYEIEGKRDYLSQGLEIYGFCTDITHKRAADGYLKLQSQILAQVSDPIVVTNLSLEVIYLNEAAAQLCCPETSQFFRGKLEDLLEIDWRKNESLKDLAESLNHKQNWKSEQFVTTKHTAASPFEITMQPIFSEGDEKIGYSFILHSLAE